MAQRNPFVRVSNDLRAVSRRAGLTPAEQTSPVVDEESTRLVGDNDPGSGEWKPYGLLDYTTFGEGFRLS